MLQNRVHAPKAYASESSSRSCPGASEQRRCPAEVLVKREQPQGEEQLPPSERRLGRLHEAAIVRARPLLAAVDAERNS